jgi:hypothetical protein
MYLDIHGSSIEAIADALPDIKWSIDCGHLSGSGEYYGEVVAWNLNVNQR